jgi:serine/threonine-protein kinase
MGELSGLSGEVIAGRFSLGSLLGQGGYGAVYEGVQLSVKRPCAIKVMELGEQAPERVVKRFKAEAVLTSRLAHPNSVVIYDFGEDAELGIFFIAMEYLEGEDLNGILKERGPMGLEDAVYVVEQIAASLEDAHARGVVHRDIKPHNVMVVPRGRDPWFVKVIDFGIARAIKDAGVSTMERLTRTGTMVGTPHYMAPEQIRDEEVDGRTDTYALGMCLYKMLTGRTPFAGGSPVDVACRQLTDQALPLSSYRHELDVPPAFEDALARAIAKEPSARFQRVGEFAEALRAAIDGGSRAPEAPAAPTPLELADTAEETVETREAAKVIDPAATVLLPDEEMALRAAADAALAAAAEAARVAADADPEVSEQTQRPNQRSTMLLFPMTATEIDRHVAAGEGAPEPAAPEVSGVRAPDRLGMPTAPATPRAIEAPRPEPVAAPTAEAPAPSTSIAPPLPAPAAAARAGVPTVVWIALASAVFMVVALVIALILT